MATEFTVIVNSRTVRLNRDEKGTVTARIGRGGLVYTLGTPESGCNAKAAAKDLAAKCYCGMNSRGARELEPLITHLFA
jgi:hypothetical protein